MTQNQFLANKPETSQLLATMDSLADRKSSWCEIGLFIMDVEKNQRWNELAINFTAWLDMLAKRLDVQRSSLWKYRAAVLIGMSLLGLNQSASRDHVLQQLSKTKADMLETLQKIVGVAPQKVVIRLVDDVFEGRVSRAELREMWKVYKSVTPSAAKNSTSSDELGSLTKAAMLSALVTAGSKWLDTGDGVVAYKVYPDLSIQGSNHVDVHFDGVIATKRNLDRPELFLHGLFIHQSNTPAPDFSSSKYCDFLWCLSDSVQSLPPIPNEIGVLQVINNTVSVVRKAVQTLQPEQVGLCAKAVLLRTL